MITFRKLLTEATLSDYFDGTYGIWKGLSASDVKSILDAYVSYRRKRNKPDTIQTSLGDLKVVYESQSKNRYYHSRSNSFYFLKGNDMIRISDHWSRSQFTASQKMNCGKIRSCWWQLDGGEKVNYRIPGEQYASVLVGGIIPLADLEKMDVVNDDGI